MSSTGESKSETANSQDTIEISDAGDSLPVVEVLTGRGVVLGKSGSGKSNSASVIVEELLDDGYPVLIVDVDGEQVAGELAASSETPMHTMIYRERDDVGGIVHTHSPYATTFASLDEPIPASHYLIAFAGNTVPVAGYEHPGTADLGRLVVETLGDEYDACLLKNHGTIAVGESPEAAFETSLMVEYCARIHYQALNISDPTLLPDEEIDTLTRRFRNYGQTSDT